MRSYILLGVLTAVSPNLLAQRSISGLPRSTIHISAFGPFGHKLENPRIYLYTPDRQHDLAKDTKGSRIAEVPYGSYTLIVESGGGGVGQRLLTVNAKEMWVRIGVPMPTGD